METVRETPQRNFSMEGRRVLVVDAAMQATSIVTWQDAFTLLHGGKIASMGGNKQKARVVVYSDDGAVIGVHRDIRVPSVIQLESIVPHHRQRVRFCRKNVIVGRDHCICQYCGKQTTTQNVTADHVIPKAQGGKTTWENVVACCTSCNQNKACRTPEQAGMKLLRKPIRPRTIIEVSVKMDVRNVPAEWRAYWTQTLED